MTVDEILSAPSVRAALEEFIANPDLVNEVRLCDLMRDVIKRSTNAKQDIQASQDNGSRRP